MQLANQEQCQPGSVICTTRKALHLHACGGNALCEECIQDMSSHLSRRHASMLSTTWRSEAPQSSTFGSSPAFCLPTCSTNTGSLAEKARSSSSFACPASTRTRAVARCGRFLGSRAKTTNDVVSDACTSIYCCYGFPRLQNSFHLCNSQPGPDPISGVDPVTRGKEWHSCLDFKHRRPVELLPPSQALRTPRALGIPPAKLELK